MTTLFTYIYNSSSNIITPYKYNKVDDIFGPQSGTNLSSSTYSIKPYDRTILYFDNAQNTREFRLVLEKSSNIQKILSNSYQGSPSPITLSNSNEHYDISYNGNYFLMSAGKTSNGYLYVAKSTDGSSWTEYYIDQTSLINSYSRLFWNGQKWMLVYRKMGSVYSKVSTNGETWSSDILIDSANSNNLRLNYFKNNWVLSVGNKVYTSYNEINWTEFNIGALQIITAIECNNDIIMFAENSNQSSAIPKIYYSSNLTSFNSYQFDNLTSNGSIVGIKWFSNNFYISASTNINGGVNEKGKIYFSPSGLIGTWTLKNFFNGPGSTRFL